MMKLHYEPTVRLVTCPTFVPAGINDFLQKETSDKWFPGEAVTADAVPEFAGRLCFDDRTEVLTISGWKPLADCQDGEVLATLNPDTREIEFQEAKKVHKYQYLGSLYTVNRRDVSFAVTPEHRQYAASGKGQFQFHPTGQLAGKRFRVLTAADNWNGTTPDSVRMPGVRWTQKLTNAAGTHGISSVRKTKKRIVTGREQVLALAELCVHYAVNGCAMKSGRKALVIYGRESRRIRQLAHILGLRTAVYSDPRNGCLRTHIAGGRTVHRWFAKTCGVGFENKKLPDWVLSLPSSELRKLWDVLVRTDGHKDAGGGERFITGSDTLAGQSQEILAKTGHSFSLRQMRGTNVLCHVVRKKQGLPAHVRPKDMKEVPYNGFVYCPSTRNGVVLTRRNGVVHYSGNCYMSFDNPRPGGNKAYLERIKGEGHGSVLEHVNFGILFTGVSRSLTHELVRHRIAAYSQLSQRYVDESQAEYVVPWELKDEVELAESFESFKEGYLTQDYQPEEQIFGMFTATFHPTENPPELWDRMKDGMVWLNAVRDAHAAYVKKVETTHARIEQKLRKKHPHLSDYALTRDDLTKIRKAARGAARSLLPNATETKILVTANVRAWRHMIEKRCDPSADAEIRLAFHKAFKLLKGYAPNLFGDYEEVPLDDGTTALTTPTPKV